MSTQKLYDVLIIGGSYAGLSAAMSLGRSQRNVLILDHKQPCNAPTPHSHNFLTQDGKAPSEITSIAKAQVQAYTTVEMIYKKAVRSQYNGAYFEIETESGELYHSTILLLATGLKDILPDLSGFADCWGKSILHCPYCHGYEFIKQPTAILANGDVAYHYALLVHNLTSELTILTNGEPNFTDEQRVNLEKNSIKIVSTKVVELLHEEGQLYGISFEDGQQLSVHAVYARPPYEQHSDIPLQLACEFTELGLLKVDTMQRTNVKDVYACGDNSSMRSVATAVSTGSFAGASINARLCEASFSA